MKWGSLPLRVFHICPEVLEEADHDVLFGERRIFETACPEFRELRGWIVTYEVSLYHGTSLWKYLNLVLSRLFCQP